jgi:hypothetical protein
MRTFALLSLCIALASCATKTTETNGSPSASGAKNAQSSPECLAANLKASDPFLPSAIPEPILKRAQSGSVAMRYDVVAGKAQNVSVVASYPPGLYDSYALQHANRYREPSGKTVAGCVMTIDIKF